MPWATSDERLNGLDARSNNMSPMSPALQAAVAPTRVRVAGLWRRLAATIVDGVVLSGVLLILGTLAALVLGHPLPRLSQLGPDYIVDMAVNGGGLAGALLVMAAGGSFAYFFLFTTLRGQTFGKHLLHIKGIDAFRERPSPWRGAGAGAGQ